LLECCQNCELKKVLDWLFEVTLTNATLFVNVASYFPTAMGCKNKRKAAACATAARMAAFHA
jgi:hypothetical protein